MYVSEKIQLYYYFVELHNYTKLAFYVYMKIHFRKDRRRNE